MTQTDISAISDVSAFVETIANHVRSNGGLEEFSSQLRRNSFLTFSTFFSSNRLVAPVFFRFADDPSMRKALEDKVGEDESVAIVVEILSNWLWWAKVSPQQAQTLRQTANKNLFKRLADQYHYDLNDILRCYASISTDSLRETLLYRSIVQLRAPGKNIGEDDELFISSSLDAFIQSVGVLLSSVVLSEAEERALNLSFDEQRSARISAHLDWISSTVDRIKVQYKLIPAGQSLIGADTSGQT